MLLLFKVKKMKKKNNNRKLYILLIILLGSGFFILNEVNPELLNRIYDRIEYSDFDEDKDYLEVTLDPCDTNTIPLPNTKANISYNKKYPYYSYTDNKARVIRVEAKQIYPKKRKGRLCDYIYPSNNNNKAKTASGYITDGNDDRGHLIADRFDGVSNSYNITAQHEVANKIEYQKVENDISRHINRGDKVTNFTIDVKYESIIDRRPLYYDIEFKVNHKTYKYRLHNENRPIEKR